jgi:integrase
MQAKITLQSVKALRPGEALYDTELKGFQVRRQAKAIVYAVRRMVGKRNVQITIGDHGAWTPQLARAQAERLLRELGIGNDPRAVKAVELTLNDAAANFMEHIQVKRAAGTAREYQGHLDQHLLPRFGRSALSRITTADVERLHLSLKDRKILANRIVATLSSLYSWAEGKHVPRGFNPCTHVERFKEVAKERYLTDVELKHLGKALRDAESEGRWSPYALAAIRLLLLTGCRRDEIRLMQWSMLDWQRATFTTPAKRGRKIVHLNSPALVVLDDLRSLPGSDTNPYVIAGTEPGLPYKNLQDVWEHVRAKAGLADVRIHDLRHSHASLAGADGASLPIIGALLGHKTAAATSRYTHLAGDPAKLASQRVGERAARALQ